MDYEVLFISVMLRAVCNEIVWNVENCRMCFVVGRVRVKIKTQNEKIVERGMDIWYYTYRKNS